MELLRRRAESRSESRGEDPWLFFRPELDWRWCSWAQAAAAVAEGMEALAALGAGRAAGANVAVRRKLTAEAVAWSLAIQALGLTAVPVEGEAPPGVEEHPVPAVASGILGSLRGKPSLVPQKEPAAAGGVLLDPFSDEEGDEDGNFPRPHVGRGQTSGGDRKKISTARIGRLAGELGRRLAAAPGAPTPRSAKAARDVVVAGGSLASLPVHVLLSWSLVSGAAVVLEPERAAYRETVRWVRPTLLAGTARQLEGLWRELAPRPARRRLRFWSRGRAEDGLAPPVDRLRAVAVLAAEGSPPTLPEAMEDLCRRAGIHRFSLPLG